MCARQILVSKIKKKNTAKQENTPKKKITSIILQTETDDEISLMSALVEKYVSNNNKLVFHFMNYKMQTR